MISRPGLDVELLRDPGEVPRHGPGAPPRARPPCRAARTRTRGSSRASRSAAPRRSRPSGAAGSSRPATRARRERRSRARRPGRRAPRRLRGGIRRRTRRAAKQRLLLAQQQVVAPLDRGAQRPLALVQILRAAGEEVQPLVEAAQERGRWKRAHAGRGELDRERQALEPDADLGDGGRVLARQDELVDGGARPLAEEADRLAQRQRPNGVAAVRPRGEAASCSSRASSGPVTSASRPASTGAAASDLLEVVEHQQHLLVAEVLRRASPRSPRRTAPAARAFARPSARPAPSRGSAPARRRTRRWGTARPRTPPAGARAGSCRPHRCRSASRGRTSSRGQERLGFLELAHPPDEGVRLRGQVRRPVVERLQRRELGRRARRSAAGRGAAAPRGPSAGARRGRAPRSARRAASASTPTGAPGRRAPLPSRAPPGARRGRRTGRRSSAARRCAGPSAPGPRSRRARGAARAPAGPRRRQRPHRWRSRTRRRARRPRCRPRSPDVPRRHHAAGDGARRAGRRRPHPFAAAAGSSPRCR